MNFSILKSYYKDRLKVKKPDSMIDNLLSEKTRLFIHEIGLPDDDNLGFSFNEKMAIIPVDLVRLEFTRPNPLCIDLNRNEAIYCGNSDDDFINTGIEQFVGCIYELEVFYKEIVAKELFGSYYAKTDGKPNRWLYFDYIENKLKNIDKAIFEKGYYWPAFLEQMGYDRR